MVVVKKQTLKNSDELEGEKMMIAVLNVFLVLRAQWNFLWHIRSTSKKFGVCIRVKLFAIGIWKWNEKENKKEKGEKEKKERETNGTIILDRLI